MRGDIYKNQTCKSSKRQEIPKPKSSEAYKLEKKKFKQSKVPEQFMNKAEQKIKLLEEQYYKNKIDFE